MTALSVNTAWQPHFKLGLLIGVWLVVLLIAIAPFDAAELPFRIRLLLLPPYGFLFMLAYLLAVGVQNVVYKSYKRWHWGFEILVVLVANVLGVLICFLYYQSDIIRGDADFLAFASAIYFPIALLICFPLFSGRRYLSRPTPAPAKPIREGLLTLQGDGRKDFLQLPPAQLLYATSAQNYVEIHYLESGETKKHLLRTTLKKLEQQTPVLQRVHRSYLINPTHFRRWSGPNSLEVYAIEVPVSKQYRQALEQTLSQIGAEPSQKQLSPSQSQ